MIELHQIFVLLVSGLSQFITDLNVIAKKLCRILTIIHGCASQTSLVLFFVHQATMYVAGHVSAAPGE